MNLIIGITGPTGSGKSSASKLCHKYNMKHIDCDIIARRAVEKDSDGLLAVVAAFGNDILNPNGTLNRKALAAKAFSTQKNTELLNRTIFPFITELVLKETNQGNILLDAPTLFESGINAICFKTIAILSDEQTRLKRIITRDHITEKEALLRINAGKNDDFYFKNADYIIYNNKTEQEFLAEFEQTITQILQQGENL